MPTIISGQVGPQTIQDGAKGVEFRQGRTAELIINQAHGRYQEGAYRAGTYTVSTAAAGVTLAAANASVTAATAQPIVGFLNPLGSGKNCAVLWANYMIQSTTVTTPVNPGIPLYQFAGPSITSTQAGIAPFNTYMLQNKGSITVGLLNQPLTGNTVTWTLMRPMITPGVALTTVLANATANVNVGGMEDLDGIFIVPPGFAFGIFVQASGTNIISAASITWEEVPL